MFLFAALGMVCVPMSLAQDKPSQKTEPPRTASNSRLLKNSPKSPAAASDKDANSKNQVPSPDSAGNGGDGDQEFDKDKDGPDQIRKRDEWFYKQRSSVNGRIPAGARFRAFQHMQRMMEAEGKSVRRPDGSYAAVTAQAPSTPAWASIGPTPTTGGKFSPVTGRVTTIAVDRSDSTGNTVLIGGAQGGIWRSTDAGNTWTAVGDQNPSLAMGSIAFAPSQPLTVYAGTGEQASIGFDVYYGAGVLKSSDGGLHWTQTCTVASATCPFIGPYTDSLNPGFGFFNFGGAHISYVAVNPSNPNMVLVGAQFILEGRQEGVYCSDDGGQTWTNKLPDEMSTFVGFASSSVAYAALGNPFGSSVGAPNGNGIYKATRIGSTCPSISFSRLTAVSLPAQSGMGRIDLGIAPSDTTGNTVYASIADASTASATNLGVFVTTNGGTSWTQTSAPDVCRNQCWYDNVVKVDPLQSNIAFFGGSAVTNGGNPNWVVRTTDTGNTWSTVIPNALGPGLPHVDTHAMAFAKLSNAKVRMYLGNDGGIWRTDDAEALTVTWTNLNDSSLTLSQFYPSLSIHTSNPAIAFGGTQDNSSQQFSGAPTWGVSTTTINTPSGAVVREACGDGGQTAVDAQSPSTVYITCQGIRIFASYLNGSAGSFFPAVNGINLADRVNFIPPLAADPGTPNVLYFGTSNVYQSQDAGNSWANIQPNLVYGPNGEYLTAIAVAPTNSKVLYVGANTGQVFDTIDVNSGGGFYNVVGQSSLPPRAVTAIAVDPADTSGLTAYVAYSGFAFVGNFLNRTVNDPLGHIFKTTDRGNTWTDMSCSVANCTTPAATDLPNIPVDDIVIDPDVPGTIYAATDLGVYVGNCTATPCTWSTVGTGLPHVAVLSLRLHEASRTLRAGTHGRGAWDINLNNFSFTGPHISSLSPTSIGAGGSSFTLAVNGTGLIGGTIQWNASTTGVTLLPGGTDTTLTATIDASLLIGGTASITVNSPSTTSNALPFPVLAAVPTITRISPASTPVQRSNPTTSVQIQLTGTNFSRGAKVLFNGARNGITVASPTSSCPLPTCLTATLPATLLGPFGSANDIAVLNLPPGGGQSQSLTFIVTAPPPPNDNFANAITITNATFVDVEDSSSATTESNDPTPPSTCVQQLTVSQGNTGGLPNGLYNTIWYSFTPLISANLEVDTIGSSYDTVLSIWTGTGTTEASLTASLVACNDDINPGVVLQSQVMNVPLTAGTAYYIMVSSYGPPDPNPLALGGRTQLNFAFNNGLNPTPTITSLSPTSIPSGSPDFTLTINGTNFISGAGVGFTFNSFTSVFLATVLSPTQLTVTVPASEVALPRTYQVFVQNAPPAQPSPSLVNFPVTVGTYPVPNFTFLYPTSILAGSLPFTILGAGSDFASSAVINFNGLAIPATVSTDGTNISAVVPTSAIATAGTVQVTVSNPAPGGGPSAPMSFTIATPNPVPTITSISPGSAPADSIPQVTITGTNFLPGAVAWFNGFTPSGANVTSGTQLTVDLSLGTFTPGTYPINVVDPSPGGTSNPFNFTITAPIPPTITSISPASAPVNTTFTLTINGTNFVGGATVFFNGTGYPSTYMSTTQISIFLPLGSTPPGTYLIYVMNPSPGGTSNAVNFTVTGPPDFSIASSGATTQTVNAGLPATFPNVLTISAISGFASPVNLSCSLPAAATSCSVSPASLASGSGSASVTITTTARGLVPPSSPDRPFPMWPMLLPTIFLAMLLSGLLMRSARTRARRLAAAFPLAIILVFFILQAASCGGGGGSTPPPPPPAGTAPGTYPVTVTGTSATTTHTVSLQLIVN